MTLRLPTTPRTLMIPLLLAGLLAACTSDNLLLGTDSGEARFLETNFLSFEHEFTDQARVEVKTG